MTDTIEILKNQLDLLAQSLGNLLQAYGVVRSDEPVSLTGPELVFHAEVAIEHRRARKKWQHVKRGSDYTELTRGELQIATTPPVEGDTLVSYRDDTGKVWFRKEGEFEDGRFREITKDKES